MSNLYFVNLIEQLILIVIFLTSVKRINLDFWVEKLTLLLELCASTTIIAGSNTTKNNNLNRANIVNANIVLPKLNDDENSSCFRLNENDIPSDSEDSKTTYKSIDSDDQISKEVKIDKANESPIKKWLSHNRDFEIKIKMVVAGKDKNAKQV